MFALFVGGMMLFSRSMWSMVGGMMGHHVQAPGPTWWDAGVFLFAVVVAVFAFALAFWTRQGRPAPIAYVPLPADMGAPTQVPATATSAADAAQVQRLQEAAVVRTLDEDERRLYLRIREAGGTALQRDLVASGAFSKAKVTRLLDKLERKGLVVRERYGATNRVRLTWKGPPAA
jgi:uncharacterized membrane protein